MKWIFFGPMFANIFVVAFYPFESKLVVSSLTRDTTNGELERSSDQASETVRVFLVFFLEKK